MWTDQQQKEIARGNLSPFADVRTNLEGTEHGPLYVCHCEYVPIFAYSKTEQGAKKEMLRILKKHMRRFKKDIKLFAKSIDEQCRSTNI